MPAAADPAAQASAPLGFFAIGVFLVIAAIAAGLAAVTLLWRGTPLDRVWVLNPGAYRQLAPWGRAPGILFLALSVILATAGTGWFQRRLWGWRLAFAIVGAQVLGGFVNCLRGDWLHGGPGLVIAGALLLFLLRPSLKSAFA